MTSIARNFARYSIAMAAGIIGGAALGLAGMANARHQRPGPDRPRLLLQPRRPTPSPPRPPSPAGTTTTAPPTSPT